uniref:Uncharacterized protein n=1 Tax=Anguilla anguilla TaxID=7936 RepID=A0A0E9QI37_ANGAN
MVLDPIPMPPCHQNDYFSDGKLLQM